MTKPETGAVTAETAMVLPLIAMFTVAMAWLVLLGITHVRALDAAREVARASARGDSDAQALALGGGVASAGSRVSLRHHGEQVQVVVRSPVRGPRGLLAVLGTVTVSAEAVAQTEPAA